MSDSPIIFLTFANDHAGNFLKALEPEKDTLQKILITYQQKGWGNFYTAATSEPSKLLPDLNAYSGQIIIFHFSGHNEGKNLQFENAEGYLREFRDSSLVAFLKTCKNLKLVFLNACATMNHVKALQEVGIPAVIATHEPVGDRQAKKFSTSFYDSLVSGDTLKEAFDKAVGVIEGVGDGSLRSLHFESVTENEEKFAWDLFELDEEILSWRLEDSADEFIPTKQIIPPEKFINQYEKGRLATTLSNTLLFRDDEIKNALGLLEKTNLLLIEGKQGVGKSKFALELLNQFCLIYPSYAPLCILQRGAPIFEEAGIKIDRKRNYIILVDDANRALKHYEYITKILHEDRRGIVKIIITVRDYAINEIEKASQDFNFEKIQLDGLHDIQIRALLRSEGFRVNELYIEPIVNISRGNPRLAIMAARVANSNGKVSIFQKLPKLYESYFGTVLNEIEELRNRDFLKVLGIIAFFKLITKEDKYRGYFDNDSIYKAFNIEKEDFWGKVNILHQKELVDLYENDSVRISDQILGEYFFYVVFIRDGILNFGTLIKRFFEQRRERFRDVLIPISNTYGFPQIRNKIGGYLDEAWDIFEKDEDLLLNFLNMFWVFDEEKTLAYLGKKIEELSVESVNSNNLDSQELLDISKIDGINYFIVLKNFLRDSNKNRAYAFDLSFRYVNKRNERFKELQDFLSENLIFGIDSHKNGYSTQTILFERLIKAIHSKENLNYPRFFRPQFK